MATKKNGKADTAKPTRAKAPSPATSKPPAKRSPSAKGTAAKRTTVKRKAPAPSHEEIAKRAYFIALEAGTPDDLDHWLRAESELRSAG
jgi:hypothetical protein